MKNFLTNVRNKVINSLTDLMIEHPNCALVLVVVNVTIVLAFFLGSGLDVHTPLND